MTRSLASVGCVGYIRVSTEKQAGETATSLQDQQVAIERLASTLGVTVGEWFIDPGYSGATMEKRPAMRELVAACEAHPRPEGARGYVLALNASRWGRFPDPEESAYWRVHLSKLGWTVRFAEGDTGSADKTVQTLVHAIHAAQATTYRDAIKANARRGSRGTASLGYWGTREPLGYRRKVVVPESRARVLAPGVRKATDEKIRLVPEPDHEAPLVREIFERYASGEHSLGSLARWLVTAAPERTWSRRTVQAVLQNPAYCGDIVVGRRPADAHERRSMPRRPEHEWVVVRDAHEALVARELWDRVQRLMAEHKRQGSGVRSSYVVSGLVTCPICGKPYRGGGTMGNGRPRKSDGQPIHFYKCAGGDRYAKLCPGPIGTIVKDRLEGAVIGLIAKELARPSMRRRMALHLDTLLAADLQTDATTGDRLTADRASLESQRDRLVAMIAKGVVLESEAERQLAQLRREIDAVTRAIEARRFASRSATLDADTRERVLALAADFPTVAKRLAGPALREFIRPWLAQATFDKRTRELTVHIRYVPAAPDLPVTTSPERD